MLKALGCVVNRLIVHRFQGFWFQSSTFQGFWFQSSNLKPPYNAAEFENGLDDSDESKAKTKFPWIDLNGNKHRDEFIDFYIDTPLYVTEIDVYEPYGAGAVSGVEAGGRRCQGRLTPPNQVDPVTVLKALLVLFQPFEKKVHINLSHTHNDKKSSAVSGGFVFQM